MDTSDSRASGSSEPKEEVLNNTENVMETVEETGQKDAFSVINQEKNSDSDDRSDDLSSNDDHNNVNSGGSSQFYESSDSKLDFAVKIEDNDTLSDIDDIKTDTASADSEDSALGSLPPDIVLNDREEDAQDRSDGSDSGIGSETPEELKQPAFNLVLPSSSDLNVVKVDSTNYVEQNDGESDKVDNENDKIIEEPSSKVPITPLRSKLKRKIGVSSDEPPVKRKKESIKFDNVTVYYFPRAQGFSCVPSQGGSTLGMEWEHSHVQQFTLAEHALEQRRLHRQILQQLKSERHSLQGAVLSSSEDSDTEEEASDISESELDLDSYYFLQPVPTRQRRALLRAAGVRKIEGYEKDECRDIRTSREFCGCACKGVCNPEKCSCSLAGIKCQVDRLNFPCGCTRDGCSNTTGRIEFNPVRVRTHFIHTLMRIGLEKKNEENQEAAKRQWAAQNAANSVTRSVNTAYESKHCQLHEDGLLRDVNLTPRVEVESCVNNGNFNNVHRDMITSVAQNNMVPHTNISYVYGNDNQINLNQSNIMHFENNHHSDPYTSNILQGKGPPYTTTNSMGFDSMSNNMQRFPCDLNYSYDHHADGNSHFKSFSASSFEEFAHSSQMSMFSHYGHNMYVPDYMHKPSTSINQHNSLQYHSMPQNQYEVYNTSTPDCVSSENKNDSLHYTTLMTMPYQGSNKLQTVENDENWYSQNMTVEQGQLAPQDATSAPSQQSTQPADTTVADTTENFGELIKKTMVDSVIV